MYLTQLTSAERRLVVLNNIQHAVLSIIIPIIIIITLIIITGSAAGGSVVDGEVIDGSAVDGEKVDGSAPMHKNSVDYHMI